MAHVENFALCGIRVLSFLVFLCLFICLLNLFACLFGKLPKKLQKKSWEFFPLVICFFVIFVLVAFSAFLQAAHLDKFATHSNGTIWFSFQIVWTWSGCVIYNCFPLSLSWQPIRTLLFHLHFIIPTPINGWGFLYLGPNVKSSTNNVHTKVQNIEIRLSHDLTPIFIC